MKLTLAVVTSAMLMAGCGQKGESTTNKETAGYETVSIKVESAVCEACASTIKDAVERVDGVKSASVDLKAKTATVQFFPEKVNLSGLETVISNLSYNANALKANAAAYEKLSDCCKVDSHEASGEAHN